MFCGLRELTSELANPFGHPSQVRTQVLVLQTCVESASTCALEESTKEQSTNLRKIKDLSLIAFLAQIVLKICTERREI